MMLLDFSLSKSRPLNFSCSEDSKSLVDRARVGELGLVGGRGIGENDVEGCLGGTPDEEAIGVAAAERATSQL